MSKLTSLFVFSLLLFFSLTSAARTGPVVSNDSSLKAQHAGQETESVEMEESCDGVGEEECLMRTTLAAHLDYIYTNKTHPPGPI